MQNSDIVWNYPKRLVEFLDDKVDEIVFMLGGMRGLVVVCVCVYVCVSLGPVQFHGVVVGMCVSRPGWARSTRALGVAWVTMLPR